ncbi:hypothetical protein G7Y89_g15006 [Cudoniella acicularis]|uniref:AB hydrolase-1 domain-containing protein n=1 Tax=Cudoniella acicularis TaxID=354080 RepID=A0A8H4VS29_9HELO|nr:hypothetical protein G7Y89_g15006 [Cudoniella acicularis]
MWSSHILVQLSLTALGVCTHINSRVVARNVTTTNSSDPQMFQLSTNPDFHFEILRDLSAAPGGGADIGEVLIAAAQIQPGDFESYSTAFNSLADRVYARAQGIDMGRFLASARDAYFAASTYFRSADFYLHGNQSDPRIYTLWAQQTEAFNEAISTLPVPGVRKTLPGDGFEIPTIFYGVEGRDGKSIRRPTIILGNGYDGSQEEMYHMIGKGALERGYNVISYEGPGQPTVRRDQNLGFIPEWEKVVTPVVDYLYTLPEVDTSAIALVGFSFGGYLAARASAFEHRLAATICLDGMHSFSELILGGFPPNLAALVRSGAEQQVNTALASILADPTTATGTRWFFDQGLWAFKTATPFDLLSLTFQYDLANITGQIPGPIFLADAQDDMFGKGQGLYLANQLGSKATYHQFLAVDGAGEHCALGANNIQNQVVFDWVQGIFDTTSSNESKSDSNASASSDWRQVWTWI